MMFSPQVPHMVDAARIRGAPGEALHHDSGLKHTTGEALYTDDLLEPAGTLHLAPGRADAVCGSIRTLDLELIDLIPVLTTKIVETGTEVGTPTIEIETMIDTVAHEMLHHHVQEVVGAAEAGGQV